MCELNFKEWMARDVFGFDLEPVGGVRKDTNDDPLAYINIETVVTDLRHPVNAKLPVVNPVSMNEMQWGNDFGAMKVTFSPLGGLTATVSRLTPDLEGHHRWVTKKVIPLSQHYNSRGIDRSLSEDILEIVTKIDRTPPETPNGGFEDMDRFAIKLAIEIRRRKPEIFHYEGVKKTDDLRHLIYMSVRGHGVQARDQRRIEQYVIDCNYEPKLGVIKVTGYGVQSTLGQHKWEIACPDFRHVFVPDQDADEVAENVLAALSKY